MQKGWKVAMKKSVLKLFVTTIAMAIVFSFSGIGVFADEKVELSDPAGLKIMSFRRRKPMQTMVRPLRTVFTIFRKKILLLKEEQERQNIFVPRLLLKTAKHMENLQQTANP